MFNLFPEKKSVNEILEDNKVPSTNWFFASTPTFTVNGITYRADELSKYISELLAKNQKLKNELNDIEEDGTEEHNNAIKLREENAQLKIDLEKLEEEIKNLKIGAMHWKLFMMKEQIMQKNLKKRIVN